MGERERERTWYTALSVLFPNPPCSVGVQDNSKGQYWCITHTGTHHTVWIEGVSCVRSVLQDVDMFSGYLHECFHMYVCVCVCVCKYICHTLYVCLFVPLANMRLCTHSRHRIQQTSKEPLTWVHGLCVLSKVEGTGFRQEGWRLENKDPNDREGCGV